MRIVVWMALICCVPLTSFSADGESLFTDDFTSFRPGWGVASKGLSIGDGKLTLKPPANLYFSAVYRGRRFLDIDVQAQVVQTSGPTDLIGGILFWGVDGLNHYVAAVQADGSAAVGRMQNGRFTYLVGPRQIEAVAKGLDKPHALRVTTSGDTAVVAIDGSEFVRFRGIAPTDGQRVGFFGEGGAESPVFSFSDLVVRAGPPVAEPRPQRDPALLFSDDFTTLDPAWGKTTDAVSVANGQLEFRLPPQKAFNRICNAARFGEIDASVVVVQAAGETNQPGGLVFWANFDDYYAFNIRSNGNFSVVRQQNKKSLTPVSLTPSDAIRQEKGAENRLRVVTSGRLAVLYINDREVGRLNGFPPSGGSRIGVYCESGDETATWKFYKVEVFPGPPASPSAVGGSLLAADDFESHDLSWGSGGKLINISGGRMELSIPAQAIFPRYYNGAFFGDADIRVKVRLSEGPADDKREAGLMFWGVNRSTYMALAITPGGGCKVVRQSDGKYNNPMPLEVAEGVKKGLGEVNELRVIAKGKSYKCYINGQQVAAFESSEVFPPVGGGLIGFYGRSDETPCKWQFSDLRIMKPE